MPSEFMWPLRAGTLASSSTKISSRYFVFDKSECFSSMPEGLHEALLTPWGCQGPGKAEGALGKGREGAISHYSNVILTSDGVFQGISPFPSA